MWTLLSIRTIIYDFLDRYSASYTKQVLNEAVSLLGQLWPYLVAGIVLSTVIRVYMSREQMTAFFKDRRQGGIILAAACVGAISPVGSYVIIPMSAGLLVAGVPLSALMALMVASPIINPNLFVLTAGAMGLEMALLRTFAALLLGSVAGYVTLWLLGKKKFSSEQVVRFKGQYAPGELSGRELERSMSGFLVELWKMTRYVGRYFLLAILLAAIIKILVNPDVIVRFFGGDSFLSVALSTGAGVPFYVCGGAAIPVVQQLADLGMSKGAVLAFFISGPVTKISNLVILQATFKWMVLLLYLAVGIIGALLLGLVYNLF